MYFLFVYFQILSAKSQEQCIDSEHDLEPSPPKPHPFIMFLFFGTFEHLFFTHYLSKQCTKMYNSNFQYLTPLA